MSTLKVNTIQNASGVEKYLCQAWVNFNGSGTVAINGSGNVSSITDNGTGDYTVNFTTAMADATYSAIGSCRSNAVVMVSNTNYTTTGFQIDVKISSTLAFTDPVLINLAIFR